VELLLDRPERLVVEELLARDERAAGEPGEAAQLEDLDVDGVGIVLGMLLPVGAQPGARLVGGADATAPAPVDQ